ncbi:MAG: tetratricopeptide repeat protein [Thermoplasmata archaeon]
MRSAPARGNLTVEEWILVHLLRFSRPPNEFEAPWGTTQYGIAEAIGTGQDHVSRAVRRLVQKGLASETKRRVDGVQERRKVYFLTPAGEAVAIALKERAEGIPVKVTESGVERLIPLRELARLLGHRHSLVEIARAIRPDGTLDHERLEAQGRAPETETMVSPVPSPFVGRKGELETLKRLLEEKKMVILHGVAGIGKTALAAKLVEELRTSRPVFWYRFHEWDTLRSLLTPFSEFLMREGRRKLRAYLASKPEIDLDEVCCLVRDSARGLKALLVFDDVHKASDAFLPCFSLLTELLEISEGIRVLLVTRQLRRFYGRSDVVVKRTVAELELDGLDESSSYELLAARRVNPVYHKRAFLTTGGHPLALQLYTPGSVEGEERTNINKYIEEEISARLNQHELALLRMASVHRYPAPAEALLYLPELTFETLSGLVSRSLLHESPDGRYDIHDFVRDFFYSRTNPYERRNLHQQAAKYYAGVRTRAARLELIHHTLRAGDTKGAIALLTRHGEELLAAGFAGELRRFFEELDGALQKREGKKLLFLRARVSDILGDWDGALELYSSALRSAPPVRRAEAHYHIGWIQQKRNRWREAETSFRRCLALSKRARYRRGVARAYHGLGRVLWREGSLHLAAEFCRKSIAAARAAGDRVLEASAGIEMGRVLASLGRFEEAEKQFRSSIELAMATGELSEAVRAKNCLAWEILRRQGRLEEALEFLRTAEEEALSQGNYRELGPIYHSLGEVYVKKGETDRAEELFKKSLEIFERLGDEHGIAYNHLGFGMVHRARRNWEKAEEWLGRAAAAFERLGTPGDLMAALHELSDMWKEKGDARRAAAFARRVRALEKRLMKGRK